MHFRLTFSCLAVAALTLLSQPVHGGIITNVAPSDITFASTQTTLTAPGSIDRGNSDQFEVRTRAVNQVTGDDARTVATFANFDISSIPAGATIMSATLSASHDTRLNSVNGSGPASVGAVATAWDTSGTLNPLFEYGTDDTGVTNALNPQVLVSDVQNTVPTGATVTADFTSTVQDWLDGTLANNGLVFFIDGFGSQGAGFNNVQLVIEHQVSVVPEPASSVLIALGLAGLVARRRR